MTDTELRLFCPCGMPLYVLLLERRGSAVLSLRNVTLGIRCGILTARGRCKRCGHYHEVSDPEALLRQVLDSLHT